MCQLYARSIEQTRLKGVVLVRVVKDLFHRSPKSLLPFEHRLLSGNVGRRPVLQTPLEEQVGQLIRQIAFVHQNGAPPSAGIKLFLFFRGISWR